jgi:two-component system cell cycle sensor histidine kinase PleC
VSANSPRAALNRDRSTASADAEAKGSLWPTTLAVIAFSLVFGCVILVKLHQEWTAARAEAEASQARTAAFIAERVSGRLSEVRGALAMAASQLEVMSPASLDAGAQAGLDNLIEAPGWTPPPCSRRTDA